MNQNRKIIGTKLFSIGSDHTECFDMNLFEFLDDISECIFMAIIVHMAVHCYTELFQQEVQNVKTAPYDTSLLGELYSQQQKLYQN